MNMLGVKGSDGEIEMCLQNCEAVFNPNFVPPKIKTDTKPTPAPTVAPSNNNNSS